MTELKRLARELDHELGAICLEVSTLEDIKMLLGKLVEEMETMVHQNDKCPIYYHEHLRMFRVLWSLTRHTVDNLSEEYTKVDKIKEEMFKVIRGRQEESPITGNDETLA